MARTNRINFKLFSFLFALERNCNKNFLQVWEVAGHGVVTLPLPAVWGWFLSGKNADLPKENQGIRENPVPAGKSGNGEQSAVLHCFVCQGLGIQG